MFCICVLRRNQKMAAPYSGIRRFLKDPDASWCDKLKLVRYSWVNDSCYFPNKHQVLVDWCCRALFANERNQIPHSDVAGLWLFLKDAFLSKQFEKIGKSIMIPTVFYSALSNTLERKPPYTQDVLLVTKAIFVIPHLCEALLAKVDISIKLLSCLLHLVRKATKTEEASEETSALILLLQNVLRAFSHKYKFRLIQKKVFEDISKETLVDCLCIHKELPVLQPDIKQFITQTIFSKDLLSAYTDYLKKNAPSSEKVQHQYVAVAMDTLEETLKKSDENEETESIIKAIPLLFDLFVTSLRPKLDISFSMLKNLLRLLGFTETKESWEGSDDRRSSVLDSVSVLITSIVLHEIYKVTDDEAENGKQKAYLKHLTSQLMSLNQLSQPSWFCSLRLLFSLDHKIMESHQVAALKSVLRRATGDPQKLEESKMDFFCEVSDTYLKLRQFPKFCEFLIKCCSLEPQDESLKFSSRIIEHLGKIIQQLPQQTSLGIWTNVKNALTDSMADFSRRLKDKMISSPPLKKKKRMQRTEVKVSDGLEGLTNLFGCVVRNCRVVEYSAVQQGSDALQVLLQQIVTDILVPSLSTLAEVDVEEQIKDVDPLLFAVLYVACCYGDVQLLLLKYTSRDSSLKERGTLTETLNDKEFHQFHSYVSRDVWRRVLEISDRLGDSRILFLLKSLSTQQIRSLVLTHRDISEVTKTSLQNLTSGLFSADYTRDDISSSPAKPSHQLADQMQLLVNVYPIIKPYMSETDRLNFATLISRLIFEPHNGKEYAREYSEVNSGASGHELAVRFSESDLFIEARDLHGHLVAKAVETFSSAMTLCVSSNTESVNVPGLSTILDNPEKLHSVVKEMTGGLTTGLQDSQIPLIKVFTKLISALPMGLLSSKNQMNCLLALTFIDFLLTKAAVIPIYDHLVCLAGVRKLAGDCVKEIRKSDVSSSIDVKAIIVELAMSHVRLSEKVLTHPSSENKAVLLDITQHTSDLISHWLRRERVWTKGSGSVKTLIKKMLSLIQGFTDEKTQQNIVGQRSSVIDLTSVIIRYCDKYSETVPSNFTEYSLSFCEVLDELIANIGYSACSPDVFFTAASISNFFLNLKECLEMTKNGGKLCHLKESQSTWLKSVLPWLPKWKLEKTLESSSKLLQAATDKCLRLASAMNEEELRGAWSSLHLLLGQQEGQMSADMQIILKVAIPLMTDSVFEQSLKESISTLRVGGESASIIAGLQLWQAIRFTELEETKLAIIANSVPDLISQSIHLLQEISLVAELDDRIASLLFGCLAYVISQGKDVLTEEVAVSSLSLCLLLPLELLSGAQFPSVFRAACTLVNNIMLAFPQSLLRSSHSFLTCLQYLLKHAMNRGQQTSNREVSDELLIACAEDMERLLTLYASHKETKQIGCFLVATFFQELQRATLLPAFKKTLIIGIYNLVDSSDFKNLSLVQRTMPTELQEVYKSFMGDYYKYHRFKGNV